MMGRIISLEWLRWLMALLISLTWATTGRAAVSAERSDFGRSLLAAKRATGAFNPSSTVTGQGLGKLAGREVRVSERGLSLVENHF